MNRDPAIWEDPLKLDPSRWLEEGKFKDINMYKYNVFNAGPRLCLGKPLAYLEVNAADAACCTHYTRYNIHTKTPPYAACCTPYSSGEAGDADAGPQL
jgi:cytochrome P450